MRTHKLQNCLSAAYRYEAAARPMHFDFVASKALTPVLGHQLAEVKLGMQTKDHTLKWISRQLVPPGAVRVRPLPGGAASNATKSCQRLRGECGSFSDVMP